jgi:hypothetical protein
MAFVLASARIGEGLGGHHRAAKLQHPKKEFAPVTPGEILKEEFLAEYGLSQNQLAKAIGISLHRYRPELHYMRGSGPKWFEKHGRSPRASHSVAGRLHIYIILERCRLRFALCQ